MKIVKQRFENDCGICIIEMWLKHYRIKYSPKDLYNYANMHPQGMSIFDLEVLAEHYGLKVKTFECTQSDFESLKIGKNYSTIINNDGGQHYVIFEKTKDGVEVYDSNVGHYKINTEQFYLRMAPIIIQVNKTKAFKPHIIKIKKTKYYLQPIYVFWILLINFLILVASLLTSYGISRIINNFTNEKELSNCLNLVMVIIINQVFMMSGNYLESIIKLNYNIKAYKNLYFSFFNNINCKKISFINKTGRDNLLMIDHYISSIVEFNYNAFSKIIVNSLFISSIIIILGLINKWFLFIIILTSILHLMIFVYEFNTSEDIIQNRIIKEKDFNCKINTFASNYNLNRNHDNIISCQESLLKNISFKKKVFLLITNLTLIKTIVKLFAYSFIFIYGSKLIVNNNYEITYFILAINVFSHYFPNLEGFMNFFVLKNDYEYNYEIYNLLCTVDNLEIKDNLNLSSIKSLSFQNKSYKNGAKIEKIEEFILQYLSLNESIKINNMTIGNFNPQQVIQKMIIIEDQQITQKDIVKIINARLFNEEAISSFVKKYPIDKINTDINITTAWKIILQSLSSSNIVLINENFNTRSNNEIIDYLRKGNFVLFYEN